jgi:hypothetical protein
MGAHEIGERCDPLLIILLAYCFVAMSEEIEEREAKAWSLTGGCAYWIRIIGLSDDPG